MGLMWGYAEKGTNLLKNKKFKHIHNFNLKVRGITSGETEENTS